MRVTIAAPAEGPDAPAELLLPVQPDRGPDGAPRRAPLRAPPRRATADEEFALFMGDAAPALARTAWLLCGDVHQADELVQQALVRTYLAWPRARERDPLAYARRVLANLRIDTWRRRRREVLTDPGDLPHGAEPSGAQRQADRDQLVRALATLSTRQRRVVVLRHLEGLSEAEVAEDLGVTVGTVKSTASRALARLRASLGEDAAVAGPGRPTDPRSTR